MIEAVAAVVERHRKAWEAAKAVRDHDLTVAIAAKRALLDAFWKAEYEARARYRAALLVAEAFDDG